MARGDAARTTGAAQRAAWDAGVLPPVERVRPGLWSVPVPIPRNPLRYVLVYVLEVDGGAVLVDAGWDTDEAWAALRDGLRTAGYGVGDVRGVLVTHIHPDHYGLAGRVREASDAWVALHPADAAALPARYGLQVDGLLRAMRGLLADCGVPEADLERLGSASMGVREFVNLVIPDVLLEDGGRVDAPGWELYTVWTPGHSPGHCCFHERGRRLLLSGDHVLPRISPNISIHAQQPGNPLADFLDALRTVRALEVEEVLPAHQWRFAGLRDRVDELLRHHAERLDELAALLDGAEGATVWELTLRLSWSRDWSEIRDHMRRAAVGETLAHLALLEASGRAVRAGHDPMRWCAAGAAEGEPPALRRSGT